MFPAGIFLDKSDKRITSFSQFAFLPQLSRPLKFRKTDVWHRRWRNFPALLFFYCDFFFYKGVVTKPGSAAEDDQRKQQDEKPLHGGENVVETSTECQKSPRTRKKGNPGSMTKRTVCEESIAATEIGFALRGAGPRFAPWKEAMPEASNCALFPVAPGKMTILAVKLLGNDFERAKQTNQRRSHEFSSHLWIFDIRRAALRATD